ncbi:MAG: hypothetical protein E7393_00815 [Ruminococcaceae bacterium]|nr:hypothetical protein [Oscillospiraceae bacterium]
MKKFLLSIVLIFLLFTTSVMGQEISDPTNDILNDILTASENIQINHINLSEDIEKIANGTFSFHFNTVLRWITDMLIQECRENIGLLIKILVLAVLAGVLCNLQHSASGNNISEISFIACFSIVAGLSVNIIAGLNDLAVSSIDNMMLLIAGLMPIMSSMIVTANITAFSGFYPGLFIAMQSFIAICKSIMLPLIMVMTALSVVNTISNRFHITRLIDLTRQAVKWGLGLLLTIFVGILGMHSLSAGATVGIAGRTVRYALCNFIPLVGNVLAESAEAVIDSIRLLRSIVGVAGVLALLSLVCLPLIKIIATSVLYRFAAGITEPATDKRIVRLLMDISGNITLIFSILLMVTVMFVISIALLCVFIV